MVKVGVPASSAPPWICHCFRARFELFNLWQGHSWRGDVLGTRENFTKSCQCMQQPVTYKMIHIVSQMGISSTIHIVHVNFMKPLQYTNIQCIKIK